MQVTRKGVETGGPQKWFTGADLLIDGGVIAALRAGRLQVHLC